MIEPVGGFVEPALAAEFPGLALVWGTVAGRPRRSSRAVRERLQALSDRYWGARVVAMRSQPIPRAYRVFFRQIGLDPDITRVPSEQAAVARLVQGGFVSRDGVRDALLLGLLETGVPVWALDAGRMEAGGLEIRTTRAGEALAGAPEAVLPRGRLVVADARHIHALLFDEVAPAHRPAARTTRLALYAVGVDGVPQPHLEEALWVCAEALSAG